MFSFIHKIKQWYKHQKLIKQSVLIPITSYDQYAALVKEAKDNSKNKVFSNCYMLPAEIKRLIHRFEGGNKLDLLHPLLLQGLQRLPGAMEPGGQIVGRPPQGAALLPGVQ